MNQLYQQMNTKAMLSNNNIRQIANMMKMSSNPQAMLNQLAQNNPQAKEVIGLIQNSGKTPKELFYQMANEKGVDPNEILNMLR